MALFVAFTPDSYWNKLAKPVAADSMVPGKVGKMNQDYVKLIDSSGWAMPIYWSKTGDPEYTINDGKNTYKVRIPKGATPMSGSDGAMIILDVERMDSFSLWQAVYSNNKWTVSGIAYYDLESDGLCTTGTNEGHRGVPPSIMAIRKDELDAKVIPHRLEVFWSGTDPSHVFPMCGDEKGRCNSSECPPEGATLAINPGLDLTKYGLSANGLTIAQCLQNYGAIVGDNSPGSGPCIKVERAAVNMVTSKELSKIPMSAYIFKTMGWS